MGAAIALAFTGPKHGMTFIEMLAFGTGTAGVPLLAGRASSSLLTKWRPGCNEIAHF